MSASSLAFMDLPLGRFTFNRMTLRQRGHTLSIGERLLADLDAFCPLPSIPYLACRTVTARINPFSLVRYQNVDYSVPVQYGHRTVTVQGFAFELGNLHKGVEIARHPRSYTPEDVIMQRLEQNGTVLDKAAPCKLEEGLSTIDRTAPGPSRSSDSEGRRAVPFPIESERLS